MVDPEVIEFVQGHLDAAASMLGCLPGNPRTDRETAERVHALRPGIPTHHALAVIEALRAMGWRSPGDSEPQAVPPKRDPASTVAARIDLGPRLGPARAFGFTTARTEGDTHA